MPRCNLLLIVLILAANITSLAAFDEDAFLYAIRVIETGDKANTRGQAGERGPYQFRRTVWKQHTRTGFEFAYNREVATTVARRHMAWLKNTLAASGINPEPRNVALAWNAGIGRVQRGTAPAQSHDYAQRVVNLMQSHTTEAPMQDPPAPAFVESPPVPDTPSVTPFDGPELQILRPI